MTDVVLADEHAIFVDAMVTALPRWGFAVTGTGDTLAATLGNVEHARPDVCLLDRHFPDGDGVDAVPEIIATSQRTRVVLLTADGDTAAMRRALANGASGYVDKTYSLSVLANAIETVLRGDIAVELANPHGDEPTKGGDALRLTAKLTARERECLELLMEGIPTDSMAKRLFVSRTTVRTHVQSILTKLGVHSRLEAATLVQKHSLLNHGP